tara:strand:- start:74270 stop:74383 length:114 start_codon:yes stop_codon:yes gene_type:complete
MKQQHADKAFSFDGSLYISDFLQGKIWKISYNDNFGE